MLHLETKKLGRIVKPGYRVTADRSVRSRGAGWEMMVVAVDEHSRTAHAARGQLPPSSEGARSPAIAGPAGRV